MRLRVSIVDTYHKRLTTLLARLMTDATNLPLTQAPVNGSHGTPGGQCLQASSCCTEN